MSGAFQRVQNCRFGELNFDDIVFGGQMESEKRINLLYDSITKHYHVIKDVTGAMTRRYVCRVCNKWCISGLTHRCEEMCSDCMSVPPCPYTDVRISCESCSRQFRSQAFFDKHNTNKLRRKSVRAEAKL